MTALTTDDLTPVERTYLGVLALGLVPADLAREPRFRMEYVAAVAHAKLQGLADGAFLDQPEFTAIPEFRQQLQEAIGDLDRKQVIGAGTPRDLVIMMPSAEHSEASQAERSDAPLGTIDVNRHPPIFDRFLAQRCMDLLMENDAVHRFLIELYAESSEVWHELYKQGYGQ